jgi:uncharacterized membrane protein
MLAAVQEPYVNTWQRQEAVQPQPKAPWLTLSSHLQAVPPEPLLEGPPLVSRRIWSTPHVTCCGGKASVVLTRGNTYPVGLVLVRALWRQS